MFLNRERAKQLIDFDGISYDGMSPTDLDGVFDFHDRAWVFFEMKYAGKELPTGQRLLLERLVNNSSGGGKQALALVVDHCVDCHEDVKAAECFVRLLYYSGEHRWRKPKKPLTVREAVDSFFRMFS